MCKGAKANLTSISAQCKQKAQSSTDHKMSCNGVQKRMDSAACKHALFSKQACDNYKKCHSQAIKPYLMLKAVAMEQEERRKKDWRVLMHMRCMLKVLLKNDCKPDEKALAECKNKPKENHNPQHLDLKFTCNLEAQICTKATMYPGSDSYNTMLANLPKDAPAQDPILCGGLEPGVSDILKKNMIPGAQDMIGAKNKGLTEEIYLFPQTCNFPELQARRPTIVRRVRQLKFPPWPDLNEAKFSSISFTNFHHARNRPHPSRPVR